ncbi:MAG: NFACT family protein, partial [Candidatus Micrarchaeota archaeon]
ELQKLAGARLTKIYELSDNEFRFAFHLPECSVDVACELRKRMNITKYIKEAPEAPTQFVMALRKHLENARVLKIQQHNFDRVLFFEFEREKKFFLIFEMFSHGNLILTDADFSVLQCYRREEWRDRKIKRKEKYEFPKTKIKDPRTLTESELSRVLSGDKQLIAVLAREVPIGTIYLEEACARAGISATKKANSLSEHERKKLRAEIKTMLAASSPAVYFDGESAVDYSLTALKKYEKLRAQNYATLSEAMDEFYARAKPVSEEEPRETREQTRLKIQLERQLAAVEELTAKSDEKKKAGDAIYENYEKINDMLETFREMKKRKLSLEEMNREMKKKFAFFEGVDKEGRMVLHM